MDLSGYRQFYNIKIDPDFPIELQDRYQSIRPGYQMNKHHWISVDFGNAIPRNIEKEIMLHAYRQTAKGQTKKLRAELGLELQIMLKVLSLVVSTREVQRTRHFVVLSPTLAM